MRVRLDGMRRNLRPISGRNTAHLVIKYQQIGPTPAEPLRRQHTSLSPPMAKELQQGRFPATYREASRSSRAWRDSKVLHVSKSKAKIHRDRRKKQRGAECFVICRKARRNRIDFCHKKTAAAKKSIGQKITNERTNARTHTSVFGARIQNSAVLCKMAPGIGGF